MTRTIRISQREFDEVLALRKRFRPDCRVAFGTNENGEIWAWTTYGLHKKPQRIFVHGSSKILDQAAGLFVELSRDIKDVSGGRFFVDDYSAFWKDREGKIHKILSWKFEEIEQSNSVTNSRMDHAEIRRVQSPPQQTKGELADGMTEFQRLRLKQAQAWAARHKK